jgi:hypothetical protein
MSRSASKVMSITTAFLLLAVSACTDPSVAPESTISEGNIFKDQGSYLAFLAKIYAGLAVTGQRGAFGDKDIQTISDEGFSQYLRLYWEHQELPSDEAVLRWGGDQGIVEFNSQGWGSSNQFVGGMFARIYFQVALVNEFLRQTTDAKLSERNVGSALRTKIQQYRAEARFLRALSYWHGLDMFGSIPVATTIDPTPPHQNTPQEVYDFIVSELNAIQTDLPAAGSGTYGRATKEAASMLLANVQLNAEVYTGAAHYAEALAAAQAVIAGPFSLDPSYRHLFLADNNTSPEMVFAVVQDGIHSQAYGGTTFLTHASCGGSMDPTAYGLASGGCWWGLGLKPEAYNRYAAGDGRTAYFYGPAQDPTVTVAIADIFTWTNGVAAPKYQNKTSLGANGSNSEFSDIDFPMFRLADAYLIYAEAVLRGGGGDRGTALGYVNALRERAYGNTSGDITDPQLTLQFILDERGRELLWEAHRRTDLVRFGVFTGGTYIWSWKGGTQAGQATDAHLNRYPIPVNQLVANPNLKQNPGY